MKAINPPHLQSKQIFSALFCCVLFWIAAPNVAKSQTVVELSPLNFGIHMALTTAQTVVIDPLSADAAVFDISGTPNTPVNITVLPKKNRTMTTAGASIKIITVVFGGSVVDQAGTATGTLNALGQLTNVRMGATVDIRKNPKIGTYIGTLTLRVVY